MASISAAAAAAAPDTNEELKLAWAVLGRADGYEAPTEQETRDLADARNRGRGQKAQRKRIKRNRQQLECERAAELGLDPPPTLGAPLALHPSRYVVAYLTNTLTSAASCVRSCSAALPA